MRRITEGNRIWLAALWVHCLTHGSVPSVLVTARTVVSKPRDQWDLRNGGLKYRS